MKLEILKRMSQLGEPFYCICRNGEYIPGTRVFVGGVVSEDDAISIVTAKYCAIKKEHQEKQSTDKTLYSEEL